MNVRRFMGKCLSSWRIVGSKAQPSYSQAGEDQITRYLFDCLKISNPSFLDIGTNHPFIGNNTYYFYIRGARGVCIEPDPELYRLIKKHRQRDLIINAGIGVGEAKEADLYIFPHPYSGWNTFSQEEARRREKETGIPVKTTHKLPLLNINQVIKQNFPSWPNLISIDVEGMDLEILQSLDFESYKPEVICAESITFSTKNEEMKVKEIIDFIESKGYFVFGDTHINTVFCRTDAYKKSSS